HRRRQGRRRGPGVFRADRPADGRARPLLRRLPAHARYEARPGDPRRTPIPLARLHPCPRPVDLMRRILHNWTMDGSSVLDPMCGSGATCIAAHLLGRRWMGIDRSASYCEVASRRLQWYIEHDPERPPAPGGEVFQFLRSPLDRAQALAELHEHGTLLR